MIDPDDRLPPPEHVAGKAEAEAQDEETVMPWVWGGVAVLVIAAFIAWAALVKPQAPPPAAPQMPPGQAAPVKE